MRLWIVPLIAVAACTQETSTLLTGTEPGDAARDGGSSAPCQHDGPARFGMTASASSPDAVVVVGGQRTEANAGVIAVQFTRAIELVRSTPPSSASGAELHVSGARTEHAAALLADGRLLVTGGWSLINGLPTALRTGFIVDARDSNDIRIESTGLAMRNARAGHHAVTLPDGRVLIAGGRELLPNGSDVYPRAIEIFDPDTQTFETTGQLFAGRYGASATLRDDGAVVVAGGYGDSGPDPTLVVIRDGRVVTRTDLPPEIGPIFHAAASSAEGVVLAGGFFDVEGTAASDGVAWLDAPKRTRMGSPRARHTLTRYGDNLVAIGGTNGSAVLATVDWTTEDPIRSTTLCSGPRIFHAAVATNAGIVVIGGGASMDAPYELHETFEIVR